MDLPSLPDRPGRLRWAAKARGVHTAAELAALMQEVESTVRSHWNGNRVFSRPKAIAYAKRLDVPFLWLWEGVTDAVIPADISSVTVRGAVQAGYWTEASEWPETDWYSVPMPVNDHRYPGIPLFGLEVRGTSMNKVFPEGSILACINLIHHPVSVESNRYVIVERRNHKGDIEATVKQIQKDETGTIWLWPRSDDPRHQSPLRADDGEEVRIIALVVRSSVPL